MWSAMLKPASIKFGLLPNNFARPRFPNRRHPPWKDLNGRNSWEIVRFYGTSRGPVRNLEAMMIGNSKHATHTVVQSSVPFWGSALDILTKIAYTTPISTTLESPGRNLGRSEAAVIPHPQKSGASRESCGGAAAGRWTCLHHGRILLV